MSSSDAIVLPSWAASFAATFERVAHHLELSEGFMLLPVELPDSITANLLVQWLGGRGLACHYIDINDAAQPLPLLERLLAGPEAATATLLFIDKLTDWLPGALQLLNQQRDVLAHRHPRPLLWCGPARFLDLTWRSAPDLWSVAAVPIRLQAPTTRSTPNSASIPITPKAALYRLLLTVYSADELDRFIINHLDIKIIALLPTNVPTAVLADKLVETLAEHQLVDEEFFDLLRSEQPSRYREIDAVERLWLGNRRTGRVSPDAAVAAVLERVVHAANQILFVLCRDLQRLHDTIQSAVTELQKTRSVGSFHLLAMHARTSDWSDIPQLRDGNKTMQDRRLAEITVVLDAEGRPLSRQDRRQLNQIRRLIHEAGHARADARPFQLVIPLAGPNSYDTRLMLREELREAGVPFHALDLDALDPRSDEPSSPQDPTSP